MDKINRFITIYLFKYFQKFYYWKKGIRIPILMYHSISNEKEKGHPYFWINTSPKRFKEHMKFLKENNYKIISLSEAVKIIDEQKLEDKKIKLNNNFYNSETINISKKTVVLTFDDGYKDFYTEAFPILQKYNFTSTVFIPTGFINKEGKSGLRNKSHLSWSEIIELERKGITFGSHTVSHKQMEFLNKNEIKREVMESKIVIEEKIGKSVDFFSYPFAFPERNLNFHKFLSYVLEKYGYKNGVCTIIGTVHNRGDKFFLKRIPINSNDDICFFKAKLEGNYDWMHVPQRYLKRLKKKIK